MAGPLYDLLPPDESLSSDELLGRFLDYVAGQGLVLYPAQEEAVLELFEGRNVILNTPTGSGKSLVASALHFASLSHRLVGWCGDQLSGLQAETGPRVGRPRHRRAPILGVHRASCRPNGR